MDPPHLPKPEIEHNNGEGQLEVSGNVLDHLPIRGGPAIIKIRESYFQ